jgi:hypothetical protein
MKIRECLLLFSLGLMIWISGTIYYAYAGHRVFRDDTGTILGKLCNFSHHLRRVLHPDSALASRCPV